MGVAADAGPVRADRGDRLGGRAGSGEPVARADVVGEVFGRQEPRGIIAVYR